MQPNTPSAKDHGVGSPGWIRRLFSLLLLIVAGCTAESDAPYAAAVDATDERQTAIRGSATSDEEGDPLAASTDEVVWQWLDANIGFQERLAASRIVQSLSGADIGDETAITSLQQLLFSEQLNLLYEIKASKNIDIAQQYMVVHTLMTLDEAEHTRSLLPFGDPRHAGVDQQVETAKQLLATIGYDRHQSAEEVEESRDRESQ